MATVTLERSTLAFLFLLAAGFLTACDDATGPTELADEHEAPFVTGQVTLDATAASGPDSGATGASPDASGILITVEGSDRSVLTDDRGTFELDLPAHGERLRLRFRRGAMDHALALDGVAPGDALQMDVTLRPDGAHITDSVRGRRVRFGGLGTFLALEGAEPRRILGISVKRRDHAQRVAVFEHRTRIDPAGDFTTFDELLEAMRSRARVRVTGFGVRRGDGLILAVRVRAEI